MHPTWFFAVPRIWEKFYSDVTIRMSDATIIGKAAYEAAIAVGRARARRSLVGKPIPWHLNLAFWVADKLVLHNIKVHLGLRRARILGTGAAPISPDLISWYLALGLEMREIYGQTENTGISTVMPKRKKLGTVGQGVGAVDLYLSKDGFEGKAEGLLGYALPDTDQVCRNLVSQRVGKRCAIPLAS